MLYMTISRVIGMKAIMKAERNQKPRIKQLKKQLKNQNDQYDYK